MRTIVIYNPKSGSAVPVDELKSLFNSHGLKPDKFAAISPNLKSDVEPYLTKDSLVVVIGGDGTIGAVANLVIGTPALFAPLQGGTLNHFAKDLGVPGDLSEAIAKIADPNAKVRKIDVASVNDKIFINNSSIGIYSSTLETRKQYESRVGKWQAATFAWLRAWFKYKTYEVTIDGDTFKTPFIFVGNNDYHIDKSKVAGRTKLDTGRLSVFAVDTADRWDMLAVAFQKALRQKPSSGLLRSYHVSKLTIHTKKSTTKVAHDGEFDYMTTPLEYKILPGALKVIGSS